MTPKWQRIRLGSLGIEIVVASGDPDVAAAREANPGFVPFTERELDVVADMEGDGLVAVDMVKRAFQGKVLTPSEVEREFKSRERP